MTSIAAGTSRLAPTIHAILRIGAGLLFMQHGLQKLFGMFGGFGGTPVSSHVLAGALKP